MRLRLTATGTDDALLSRELDQQVAGVLPIIEQHIYGYDNDTLESIVGRLLKAKNWTLGIAESCTGGAVSARITSVPGSSAYFQGSVVSYSNDVKVSQLGVSPDTLATVGAVSEETIRQMAEGVRKALNTDVGIATSGIAGPDGGTPDKPVGTIWIAVATPAETRTRLLTLSQYRDQNIQLTTTYLLNLLRDQLEK